MDLRGKIKKKKNNFYPAPERWINLTKRKTIGNFSQNEKGNQTILYTAIHIVPGNMYMDWNNIRVVQSENHILGDSITRKLKGAGVLYSIPHPLYGKRSDILPNPYF